MLPMRAEWNGPNGTLGAHIRAVLWVEMLVKNTISNYLQYIQLVTYIFGGRVTATVWL